MLMFRLHVDGNGNCIWHIEHHGCLAMVECVRGTRLTCLHRFHLRLINLGFLIRTIQSFYSQLSIQPSGRTLAVRFSASLRVCVCVLAAARSVVRSCYVFSCNFFFFLIFPLSFLPSSAMNEKPYKVFM